MNNDQTFKGVVLFAENGTVNDEKRYGYDDYTSKELLTTASVFDLASVTKQFTAMVIAILEHDKELDFQESIATYIP
jgi:CubicO group peptidase (beta-lactamase class C family)